MSTQGFPLTLEKLARKGRSELARTWPEAARALAGGAGAGAITGATVVAKYLVLKKAPLASPGAGALLALDFAASFLLMQALGFKLATKQSSLLGVALGARWRSLVARSCPRHVARELKWVLRTQVATVAGNLVFVVPAALLFQRQVWAREGSEVLDPATAEKVLRSHAPTLETLSYAVLTGALLWACARGGAQLATRFRSGLGSRPAVWFNVLIGVALGVVPMIGKALALPLDVRHVTLSCGAVAMAALRLGPGRALAAGLVPAALGVACIGALNLGVSFLLAFRAARAKSRVVLPPEAASPATDALGMRGRRDEPVDREEWEGLAATGLRFQVAGAGAGGGARPERTLE